MDLNGLIVGLGNPGAQYRGTRHNIGFMSVQTLLEEVERGNSRAPEQLSGSKFNALLWRIQIPGGGTWLVAEPQTFMNLSGDAVQPLMAWYRLKPEQLLVVHDDSISNRAGSSSRKAAARPVTTASNPYSSASARPNSIACAWAWASRRTESRSSPGCSDVSAKPSATS